MELVAVIATVILVATFLTLMFSFAAYFVTRAKKLIPKRSAEKPSSDNSPKERIFFKRYLPEGMQSEKAADNQGKFDNQWM